MNRQQSIDLVRQTFESSFDRARFGRFTRELLNTYQEAEFSYTGNLIHAAFREDISKLERIGKYEDEAGKRIDILIVHLKRETSIERARSMQRNFIAGYLQGKFGTHSEKDAVLVAFVAPNRQDWRFSLVRMDVRLEAADDGRVEIKEAFTPAKRWSFLVGDHEKSHTAQKQFQPILADDEHNPTLAQLEEAFNIETVTREFFTEYRRLFIWTKDELDKAVAQNPQAGIDLKVKRSTPSTWPRNCLGKLSSCIICKRRVGLECRAAEPGVKGQRIFYVNCLKRSMVNTKTFSTMF